MSALLRAFGRAVMIARSRRAWTQEELAKAASMHRADVSDIERGARDAGASVQWRVAQALNMKLSELWALAEREAAAEPAERGGGS